MFRFLIRKPLMFSMNLAQEHAEQAITVDGHFVWNWKAIALNWVIVYTRLLLYRPHSRCENFSHGRKKEVMFKAEIAICSWNLKNCIFCKQACFVEFFHRRSQKQKKQLTSGFFQFHDVGTQGLTEFWCDYVVWYHYWPSSIANIFKSICKHKYGKMRWRTF